MIFKGGVKMNELLIKNLLQDYGFKEIGEIKVIRDKAPANAILKCICDHKAYIMKIYKDGWSTTEKVNKEGILNNYFIENGMPFARILMIKGKYSSNIMLDGVNYAASLEEFIDGISPEKITYKMSKQMAKLLAKEHLLSQKCPMHFDYPSCWSLIRCNCVTNDVLPENYEFFLKFMENARSHHYDHELLKKIEELYYSKRNALMKLWDKLPSGPIQGDFGEYNMFVDCDENVIGICDFNIAGDEVFVNEFASIIGWNVDDPKMFIDTYTSIRPLNELEKEAYPLILQITAPFKFYRVNDIIKLIEENKIEETEEAIKETIMLLKKSYKI